MRKIDRLKTSAEREFVKSIDEEAVGTVKNVVAAIRGLVKAYNELASAMSAEVFTAERPVAAKAAKVTTSVAKMKVLEAERQKEFKDNRKKRGKGVPSELEDAWKRVKRMLPDVASMQRFCKKNNIDTDSETYNGLRAVIKKALIKGEISG